MSYLAEWLSAFALTQAIEVPIVVVLTRGSSLPAWRRAGVAFLASLATHPIVWFVIPELGLGEPARYVASEGWAFVGELLLYKLLLADLSWARAAAVSFGANAASFALGLVLWRLISP